MRPNDSKAAFLEGYSEPVLLGNKLQISGGRFGVLNRGIKFADFPLAAATHPQRAFPFWADGIRYRYLGLFLIMLAAMEALYVFPYLGTYVQHLVPGYLDISPSLLPPLKGRRRMDRSIDLPMLLHPAQPTL